MRKNWVRMRQIKMICDLEVMMLKVIVKMISHLVNQWSIIQIMMHLMVNITAKKLLISDGEALS